ncbi:MAG: UDP-N-acetylmuramoyl-tripeptide--D-alanyl-D-alanine ligase [Phycisphaerales bacterium]|nr:UDP-N-acetylmuramoyl-tripeptide--D-alanyl-D-alanine ligase [Phycisphaerales bacterium]
MTETRPVEPALSHSAPTEPAAPRVDAPFWTASILASATGGKWSGKVPDGQLALSGVCIDSRAVAMGCAFVAIRGDNHDGHEFAARAAEAGAAVVITSRPVSGLGSTPVLVVEDTRRALGRLAGAYREHLAAQGTVFIAVCGSNGKTTTVRMIDAVLRAGGLCGTASQKSFNNDVGVPLTVLSARVGDQFVLCEVGTNHPGEINMLGAIVRPGIAVITSIGREHLEGFGDLAGVMREEGSIASHLRENGTLLHAEAPALEDGRTFEGLLATYTNHFTSRCMDRAYWIRRPQAAEIAGVGQVSRVGVQWKDLHGNIWRVPLGGEHNAANAMLAVWVGQAMGLDNEVIAAGLLNVEAPAMRQQVITAGPVTVVNDAYNANPDSMLAALAAFSQLTPSAQRRVAIIGQMGELGASAAAAHAEVLAAALAQPGIGAVIVVGPLFAAAAADVPPGALLAVEPLMSAESAERLASYIKPGDAVLVKGSRSQAMERVVDAISARFASRPGAARPAGARPTGTTITPGKERTAP